MGVVFMDKIAILIGMHNRNTTYCSNGCKWLHFEGTYHTHGGLAIL